MSLCLKCKNSNIFKSLYSKHISCTVDENGLHHSYNDEPAIKAFYQDEGNTFYYMKHGIDHRRNNPSVVYEEYGEYKNLWFYEGQIALKVNRFKLLTDVIIFNYENFYINYIDKVAIILEQMKDPYKNVYLCLIDNNIKHVIIS